MLLFISYIPKYFILQINLHHPHINCYHYVCNFENNNHLKNPCYDNIDIDHALLFLSHNYCAELHLHPLLLHHRLRHNLLALHLLHRHIGQCITFDTHFNSFNF